MFCVYFTLYTNIKFSLQSFANINPQKSVKLWEMKMKINSPPQKVKFTIDSFISSPLAKSVTRNESFAIFWRYKYLLI